MFTHRRKKAAGQFEENQENKDGFSLRFEGFCGRYKQKAEEDLSKFPVGSVAKTPTPQYRGPGFTPVSELDPTCLNQELACRN